ncbi:farnesyl-diphosphate farnesyltransferase [Metschnikowia bicuspidata var. bicuspidata NRRL YB-4993]|uniref:Squalene synthase n=1 Tax=Metschnikowia bicuspidata var. bicuspidata NRRL YB-4993 TaxID=869754 RepID=A0A1A0HAF7_9ASCO|nr:farnesyl-diphosphate farnesyltransferase [Metschnikowia bicuspidata var. bicuspidata NRRL YB-4993]OBA21114.1 farnesyl-diphosphate farnesyltransferase [Metschnikowia bicuspidata var. bicuspidata NRRL YB-4993]
MGKLLQLLAHPTELLAAVQFFGFKKSMFPLDLSQAPPTLVTCYKYLDITSRSFAAVIKELHPELRDAIMIFYLVLRALDTVEDDMTIDPKIKVPLLRSFHEKLSTKDWTFDGNAPTEKDRVVLTGFDNILAEFHKLKPAYQDIVKRITMKMGNGMADYILDDNFNTNGVSSVADYDLYCHYVAGLVGEGLTDLMVLAKFADSDVLADNYRLSNSMGLFLQKVNIIRDYYEDLEDGRSFYPREIWLKYTDALPNFHNKASEHAAGVACINDLVLNALGHAIDVLTYLSLIKEATSFNFCAIPQVMAIATMAEIYNNENVLHKNVKIRKGTTCKLILGCRTLPGVVEIFRHYLQVINKKSDVRDPNYLKIGIKLGEIQQFCDIMYPPEGSIPRGAKRSMTKINENIEKRGTFDVDGARFIQQEVVKCRGAVFLVVAVLVTLVLRVIL